MAASKIPCPETIDEQSGRELFAEIESAAHENGRAVTLDLSQTRSITNLGGAWLVKIADGLRQRGSALHFEGARDDVAEFVELLKPGLEYVPKKAGPLGGIFDRITDRFYAVRNEFADFGALLIDAVYWTTIGPVEGRRFRWNLLLDEMHEMGVRAIPITCLMNFLLGFTIALLSAAQVESYGLTILVANLVVIAFARELASFMTAVVVSARTGAAIAAEIATMKVQEELDALQSMGIPSAQYLVAPKLLALVLVMPCLTVLGMLFGTLGGAVWGIYGLGFLPDMWYNQTINALSRGDIFQGLMKCVFFAITIVFVGCHNGFRVSGGSRGVGLVTTRAVVMDIFFIVVIDMIFATIFYYAL